VAIDYLKDHVGHWHTLVSKPIAGKRCDYGLLENLFGYCQGYFQRFMLTTSAGAIGKVRHTLLDLCCAGHKTSGSILLCSGSLKGHNKL